MKEMQEEGFAYTGFSSEMEDLKNGGLFQQPTGYFDELEEKLFSNNPSSLDQNTNTLKPVMMKSRPRQVALWLSIAASIALFIYFVGSPSTVSEVDSYTNSDIIDYLEYSDVDMIEIVESLDHIPTFDVELSDELEVYYEYIAENIADFEDIIY